MKKFLKISLIVSLSLIATFFGVTALVFLTPPSIEFSREKLVKTSNSINYYDANNALINDEKNNFKTVKIEELSEQTKQAFIAIEDKNFYKHKGVDYKRIVGASLKNLKRRAYVQGASTISQQLIKNTHLTSEKTLKRKINEIKLTKILEKTYTKDQILEMYLNTIYFGENCYGLEQAANKYFSKSASELSLSESATLAGIITAPSKLNPIKNAKLSKQRRNLVLDKMNEYGYAKNIISLKNEDVIINYKDNYDTHNSYLKAVENELEQIKESKPYMFTDCKVYTDFDKTQQQTLEKARPSYQSDYQAMIVNNKTRLVTAYLTSCGEIERSPASTAKSWLVYAPCLEENIVNRYTIINDEATDFGGYSPQNYGGNYYGNVSVEKALSKSLNVPAVKLLNSLTVDKAKSYAKNLNIEIDSNNLGIALGSFDNGIKMTQLLGAYSTFANYGNYQKCSFIKKIVSNDGFTLYQKDYSEKQVFSDGTATLMNEMLKTTAKSGTARALAITDYDVSAKTGTNGNAKGNLDAYSVAYTANHTFGVWLGNADNKLMSNDVTGSTLPTISLRQIINAEYAKTKPDNLELKGVVTLKLDKAAYSADGEIMLSCDGELERNTFDGMFKLGTEPKNKASKVRNVTHNVNPKLNFNDNKVSISYTLNENQFVEISRKQGDKKRVVYDGKEQFSEKLSKGVYEYFIKTYYPSDNNEKNFSEETSLGKIKVSSESDKVKNNDWWDDILFG